MGNPVQTRTRSSQALCSTYCCLSHSSTNGMEKNSVNGSPVLFGWWLFRMPCDGFPRKERARAQVSGGSCAHRRPTEGWPFEGQLTCITTPWGNHRRWTGFSSSEKRALVSLFTLLTSLSRTKEERLTMACDRSDMLDSFLRFISTTMDSVWGNMHKFKNFFFQFSVTIMLAGSKD